MLTWRSSRSEGRWQKLHVALASPGFTRLFTFYFFFQLCSFPLQESEATMPDMDGLNMGGPTFSVGGGGKKKKGKGKKH